MFPFVRTATFTNVSLNAVHGSDSEVQVRAYANPMLIDEIRFRTVTAGVLQAQSPLVNFRLELKLGQRTLVRWVPVGLLFRILDPSRLSALFGYGGGQAGAGFGVWRPRTPIYVPAGQYLVPRVWNAGLGGGTATRSVSVAYVGRMLDRKSVAPPKCMLPWATAYVGGSQTSDFAIESKISDLFNPGPDPLLVERLSGFSPGLEKKPRDVFDKIKLRMSDWRGNVVVRSRTPWADVFNVPDQNWEISNATLPAQGYYRVFIDGRLTGLSTTFNPCIALIGEHEVRSDSL